MKFTLVLTLTLFCFVSYAQFGIVVKHNDTAYLKTTVTDSVQLNYLPYMSQASFGLLTDSLHLKTDTSYAGRAIRTMYDSIAVHERLIALGTNGQYFRGDKIWVNFPTIPTNTNQLTNGNGFISSVPAQTWASITGKPTTFAGYSIDTAYLWSVINGKQAAGSYLTASALTPYLLKTDTSTLSVRIDAKLAIATAASTYQPIGSYLTASSLTPYLLKTDTSTISNRINLKMNFTDTASLSARINTKPNFTDTISLSNRINAKPSFSDTVSLSNRINAKPNFTDTISLSNRINALSPLAATDSIKTRALNTAFVVSATRRKMVNYTVSLALTLTLTTGSISLQTSPDNVTYTEISRISNQLVGLITIIGQLTAVVPPTYWVKLVTTGTGTSTYITGQESTL